LIPALIAVPGTRTLLRGIGEFASRWIAREPDPVTVARVRSHVVATAYDRSGAELARVRLVSGDPYQLTAGLLAWGAWRAGGRGASCSGARGPVEGFGVDALETGARAAGLRRH